MVILKVTRNTVKTADLLIIGTFKEKNTAISLSSNIRPLTSLPP